MGDLKQAAEDYFTNYQVEDIVYPSSEILFILESPHTEEIKYGYPVAGSSGREMTKFIYGDGKEAFGKLVDSPQSYEGDYPGLKKFGLANVCPAPMQKQALASFELEKREEKVVEILEKLRINYQAAEHRAEEWNLVKELIIVDFKNRIKDILTDYQQLEYLVPCGKFAANYFDLIRRELEPEAEIISGIPHPSFNQWQSSEKMEQLIEIIA